MNLKKMSENEGNEMSAYRKRIKLSVQMHGVSIRLILNVNETLDVANCFLKNVKERAQICKKQLYYVFWNLIILF